MLFAVRKTVVVQCFARFQTNLGHLLISQDICYVQMTDNNNYYFLNIYGYRANLLNNNNGNHLCTLTYNKTIVTLNRRSKVKRYFNDKYMKVIYNIYQLSVYST